MKPKSIFYFLLITFFCVKLNSQISFTLSTSKCKNDTMILSANAGSLSGLNYTWTCIPTGGIFLSPNSATTNLTFQNVGTYNVFLIASNASNTYTSLNSILINSLPTINVVSSTPTTCVTNNTIALSKPVILSAIGGVTYVWAPLSSTLMGNPNGPSQTVRPITSTCFSVLGTDANGCKNQTTTCITVLPRYSITVSPANTTLCLNTNPDGYVILNASNPSAPAFGLASSHNYFWSGGVNAGILTNPMSASVAVAPSNFYTYKVEMTDSLGCISVPQYAAVFVQVCNALENINGIGIIKIYPNPVANKFFIETENSSKVERLSISNSVGQLVFSLLNPENKNELDISNLPNGVYFLRVENEQGQGVFKVVKE